MGSKGGEDRESVIMSREMLLKLEQKIEKATSEFKASGSSSASTSTKLQKLSKQIQLLLVKTANAQDPSKPQIRDELDKVFAAEEVGHPCDLCQRDLASDPERPNASLRSLQEACVLPCGHVYHFKCLRGTTLDLDNHSTSPSCILCVS